MTDHLPDDVLVENLSLQQYTINALRAANVLTLGELRLMTDQALLRLRRFGPGSLAQVRSLVPAPGRSGELPS